MFGVARGKRARVARVPRALSRFEERENLFSRQRDLGGPGARL